ncbi:MAG: mannan endo,4-beta-mannosidase [Clostridium butyricum]|uniref:glycosyl hydrolase n=1 Tax=Clostridium butyricum TaxID=1492 RepID=UPI0028FD111B|nr:glycosyl hydrolase [Clostridium butyricum]MDK2827456.1 mannan endo,4-beta-mannosidase [Clostridium butyricum]MDU0323459.1 glycosyl hydrolase [Clostridium butyricum]
MIRRKLLNNLSYTLVLSLLITGSILPIRAYAEEANNVYVSKQVKPQKQEIVNQSDLSMPSRIKLVDFNATKSTRALFSYLKGIGKSDNVLYGHQNETHRKAVATNSMTNSDTKDVTGSIAAICGVDASFTGDEVNLTDEDKVNGIDDITKCADMLRDIDNQGGIITISAHMPNFELVKEKGKKDDGKYDYSEYSSNITKGDIVSRIMPGGDLNDVYLGYLDRLSELAEKLQDSDIPVLFRPFHENHGSWFWWGKAFCDEEAYKNLYRYTVEYLRDVKNIHNFLYVYSPNGFENEEEFLSRYPGDEFVDVLAFDSYDNDPTEDAKTDPWMKSFEETVDLVSDIADKRDKVSAVAETGIMVNGGTLALSGNKDKDWFSEISEIVGKSNMSYYMVWSNDNSKSFFSPFMVDENNGHEMINKFIDYYNEDNSIFADGVGQYKEVYSNTQSEYYYGYILSPVSGNRILNPTKLKASVKNYNGTVRFILKNKSGLITRNINANFENGFYCADITQEDLNCMGESLGTIALYSGESKLDEISALFNIKEKEKDPKLVDDFESYGNENTLLQKEWATNAGPGCSVEPCLVRDQDKINSGNNSLDFNYKISNEKTSEGWAGITKNLNVNWSDYDALQFWCRPDGKGQKLVIQITSNGEDFEVYMPEFASTTEAQLITLPFSEFKGKNNGVFDSSHIDKFGIWCNTISSGGSTNKVNVDSNIYFDDIKAVRTN